jgi:CHASE2 domain-containing sensor protein/class 3 adenylate cyclase
MKRTSLGPLGGKTAVARITRRLQVPLLILGVGLTLATIAVDRYGLFEIPENSLYDVRARHFQYFAPPPSPDIVHLDIDDSSIGAIGQWPWPRAVLADMMDEIRLAGPKAVLLDILFIDPARTQWEPGVGADGKPHFSKVDQDLVLAGSFRRMGNAIVPANLRIEDPPPVSPLELRMRDVLRKNLEYGEQQVAQLESTSGVSNALWLTAYISGRRFVARERISQLWDRINPTDSMDSADLADLPAQAQLAGRGAVPATQTAEAIQTSSPATQSSDTTQPAPTTGPAQTSPSRQASVTDLKMSLPLAGLLEQQIIVQLLPHTDLTINSALLRTVDEAFRHVRAERIFRRLSYPIPAGLPPLYGPTDPNLPVPELSVAAGATAFVDYPNSRDGKIREVPLIVQYEGRMYPQIGLMLASMMLGVSPGDFRFTPDTITIPMTGKPDGKGGVWKHDISLPIRTYQSPQFKQPIPTYFNIPWYGTKDWEAMYDQAHPQSQKQHLSITVVNDISEGRRRIETTNRKIDGWLQAIFDTTHDPAIASYLEHPPSPQQPMSRHDIITSTFKVLAGLNVPLDKSPDDPDVTDDDERVLYRNIKALRQADLDSLSLADQLRKQREFLRGQLQNKGVLIGAVATGMDLKATSIHPSAPGVVSHGTIVNGIMTGRMWRVWPPWVTVLITLAAGLLTTAFVARLTPLLAVVSALALATSYLLLNGMVLFDYGNVVVGLAGPLIAVGVVWAVCTLVKLISERRERARITSRFSNYVDPALVDWMVKHPEQTTFDGVTREMSMVFSDLVGFTTLTEKLGEKAIPLLREYMGMMIPAIRAYGGLIGCLMGDGIYCFFGGAPEPDPDHALHAVQSVYRMQAKLAELNESFKKRGLPTLGMRVGVTTGHVIVGDGGCPPVRSDYTALGDAVNLAARLESANKPLGTNSLITDRTAALLNGAYIMRPVAKLRVKGKEEAVAVFEPLCPADAATPETRRIVQCTESMVSAYQQADFKACVAAADCLEKEMATSKKLAHIYRELAEEYLAHPPEQFDGSVTLTEK